MLAVFVMGLRAEKHANKTMIIVTNIDLEERKGTVRVYGNGKG